MKIFKIEENDSNQRLDKFLKKLFPLATRGLIYKLNRKSKIKILEASSIDNKFQKKDNEYKLQIGDQVKIFLSDKDFVDLSKLKEEKKVLNLENKIDKKDIVFEDNYLLILNKNPGIDVHPGDYKTDKLSLITQVHDYLGGKVDSLTFKASLVHRIDRDTSGIIIIAKKKDILSKLVGDFKAHSSKKLRKTYLALVLGKLQNKSGVIDKKLLRIKDAKNENKVQISKDGKVAITNYKVLEESILETKNGKQDISLLEIYIETGRMHQIRIHLSDLGHPILGDKKYGDKSFNSYLCREFSLCRQALHSHSIKLFHYGRNKEMTFEARLKKDMEDFINILKRK